MSSSTPQRTPRALVATFPDLPDYKFHVVNYKKGYASKNQVEEIVETFFRLIGERCDYEVNYSDRVPFGYIWFSDVVFVEKFLNGNDLEITIEKDDPTWTPPSIPLKEATDNLLDSHSWDENEDEDEMNFDDVKFDFAGSSSDWSETPKTLEQKIKDLERSYIRPKIKEKKKVGNFLRYKYSPEQLRRVKEDARKNGENLRDLEYGSISIEKVSAWSPHDQPCVHNVLVNTNVPAGVTENDIRRLMGKFATTPTVSVETKFGRKEIQSPIVKIIPTKDGKYGKIYVTYDPHTHDAHTAWQMRAFVNGFVLDNGKPASFAFKRQMVHE